MILKKAIFCLILGVSSTSSSFAGPEDWSGEFTFKPASGNLFSVIHTPKFVRFSYMQAGKCIKLDENTRLDNIKTNKSVQFCTDANIETFKNEVKKLGSIVEEYISVGPTYTL